MKRHRLSRPAILGALMCVFAACAETTTPTTLAPPPGPSDSTFAITESVGSSDLAYLGAFRLPSVSGAASSFDYGGNGLAHRPGPGLGSLFTVGHDHQQLVAEVGVVEPVVGVVSATPIAPLLQPFADVTGGVASATVDEPKMGGLAFLADQPGMPNGALHWTFWKWYNVTEQDFAGHGYSGPDLSDATAAGVWRLNGYHNQSTAGYLFDPPKGWADAHLGGRRLLSGQNGITANQTTSWGPAFFAYAPFDETGQAMPVGTPLEPIALAYYPFDNGAADGRHLSGHHIPDRWGGATWVSGREGQHGIVVVGRRSLGETRYGVGAPGDCSVHQGYHGDPYSSRFLFYDPRDLEAVAAGTREPWQVEPIEEWDPSGVIAPTCEGYMPGAAFDVGNGRLYVVQEGADTVTSPGAPQPLIHVFRVGTP